MTGIQLLRLVIAGRDDERDRRDRIVVDLVLEPGWEVQGWQRRRRPGGGSQLRARPPHVKGLRASVRARRRQGQAPHGSGRRAGPRVERSRPGVRRRRAGSRPRARSRRAARSRPGAERRRAGSRPRARSRRAARSRLVGRGHSPARPVARTPESGSAEAIAGPLLLLVGSAPGRDRRSRSRRCPLLRFEPAERFPRTHDRCPSRRGR